jgi:hypothetical protein
VLLLVGAAYLTQRAIESGKTKHLAWCGVVVGLAFMTKLLQGWMIVPALRASCTTCCSRAPAAAPVGASVVAAPERRSRPGSRHKAPS